MAMLFKNSDLPIPVEPTTYICLRRSSCFMPKRTLSFLKVVSPKNTVSVGSVCCIQLDTMGVFVQRPPLYHDIGNPTGGSPFLASTLGNNGDLTPMSGRWYIVANSSVFKTKAFIGNDLFLNFIKKNLFFLYSFCALNGHLPAVIVGPLSLKLLMVCKANCLKAPTTPDICALWKLSLGPEYINLIPQSYPILDIFLSAAF